MSKYKDYRIKPGQKLNLSDINPKSKGHLSKEEALEKIAKYRQRLFELQATMYAEGKQSLLIVLQALDAAGKDGTVNHVISSFNPQGARVVGFKQPTHIDLARDFLWRVHLHVPANGEIVVFNRSHYEDVLVTRVHNIVDKDTWKARYKHIRNFEKLLLDNNTRILKFFLHIDKEEQLKRFASRIEDPSKNWKITESDYSEREFWDDYTSAYEDAISETSTKEAPWYVIPANHKWYRNLVISKIIVDTLESMNMAYPECKVDLNDIRKKYHKAAAELAKEGNGK